MQINFYFHFNSRAPQSRFEAVGGNDGVESSDQFRVSLRIRNGEWGDSSDVSLEPEKVCALLIQVDTRVAVEFLETLPL